MSRRQREAFERNSLTLQKERFGHTCSVNPPEFRVLIAGKHNKFGRYRTSCKMGVVPTSQTTSTKVWNVARPKRLLENRSRLKVEKLNEALDHKIYPREKISCQ